MAATLARHGHAAHPAAAAGPSQQSLALWAAPLQASHGPVPCFDMRLERWKVRNRQLLCGPAKQDLVNVTR
eukprot:SM000127S26663  [mRNA]  locus=s127:305951:306615:+ [translate_table: standard]